ncbi:transposase, partial [Candidatus Chryseobacterium massiliae]
MLNDQELLKFLLPPYLVDYFDIVKFEEKEGLLHLYFE